MQPLSFACVLLEQKADMTTPTVSVIIPTFNHAQFLKAAIQSVVDQTLTDWEAIVVNNYSKDNTIEIIESFNDTRIRLVNFCNNGIIAASRNYGIRLSLGAFIAFLDSDDIWLPDKLEKQVELFKKSNETALVYTRFKTIKGDTISNTILPGDGKYTSGRLFELLYLRSFVACSSVMVRKSILDQVGIFDINPNLIAIEDVDLWLKISLKYVIKCANNSPLLLYRIQPGGISQNYFKQIKRFFILRKRYKKEAGNYLFAKSVLLSLAYFIKQKIKSSILRTKGIYLSSVTIFRQTYRLGRGC